VVEIYDTVGKWCVAQHSCNSCHCERNIW
jgi:hypothetical protein